MRSLGFDHFIDYTKEDFTRSGRRYDLILDVKTNRSIFDYTRALTENGIYVTVGGSLSRLFQALILAPFISLTRKKSIRIVSLKPNKDLLYINEMFNAGKLRPLIDGPYMLEQIQTAFMLFGKSEHKGKVVITLRHSPGQ
jgi:NADPH:quinone reductase-like Zn-dependent oxidoreductase